MGEPDTAPAETAARLSREAKIADRSARNAAADDLTHGHAAAASDDAAKTGADETGVTVDREEAERRDLDAQLDEGLRDSFPASDPVSVTRPKRGIGRLEPEDRR